MFHKGIYGIEELEETEATERDIFIFSIKVIYLHYVNLSCRSLTFCSFVLWSTCVVMDLCCGRLVLLSTCVVNYLSGPISVILLFVLVCSLKPIL